MKISVTIGEDKAVTYADLEDMTAQRDAARELLVEKDAQIAELSSRVEQLIALSDPSYWKDRDDQWSDAINAIHPMNATDPKRHHRFMVALAMVGNRHGKYELVGLTQWLLTRAEKAEAEVKRLNKLV